MKTARARVMREVWEERKRQDERWGEQNYPDGTGQPIDYSNAKNRRIECDRAAAEGKLTFRHILAEEASETFAESDIEKLRAELVQVAAVAVCWIEAIDRRESKPQAEGA